MTSEKSTYVVGAGKSKVIGDLADRPVSFQKHLSDSLGSNAGNLFVNRMSQSGVEFLVEVSPGNNHLV